MTDTIGLVIQPKELDFATKDEKTFRNYEDSYRQEIVVNHYTLMREKQTLENV